MNIRVKANHVEITAALKDYADKKMQKLEKFYGNIQEVIIEMVIEGRSDVNDRQSAIGTVYAAGTIIHATESSMDMYASIDMVFDKLAVQLKKYKEKSQDHRHEGRKRLFTPRLSADDQKRPKELELSQEDLFVPKPLEAEEAVRRLREGHLPFLVYRNFKTEAINVVYPIAKDEFGIINP